MIFEPLVEGFKLPIAVAPEHPGFTYALALSWEPEGSDCQGFSGFVPGRQGHFDYDGRGHKA